MVALYETVLGCKDLRGSAAKVCKATCHCACCGLARLYA